MLNENKLIVNCDNCGKKIDLRKSFVRNKMIYLNGKKLLVTYFICKHCKEIYFIYIEDEPQWDMKINYDNLFIDLKTRNLALSSKEEILRKAKIKMIERNKYLIDKYSTSLKRIIHTNMSNSHR